MRRPSRKQDLEGRIGASWAQHSSSPLFGLCLRPLAKLVFATRRIVFAGPHHLDAPLRCTVEGSEPVSELYLVRCGTT